MHNWLRITLLAVCGATGVAVALAIALNPPTGGPQVVQRARAPKITAFVVDDPPGQAVIAPPPAPAAPIVAPPPPSVTASPPPPVVVSPPAEPVVAPYRDAIARQVGQLEETLQELEESSHRRERSMMRALAAIQERIDEPRPVANFVAQAPAAPPPAAAAAEPAADEPPQQPEEPTDDLPRARKIGEPHADVRRDEGDDKLTLSLQNSDIRAVLELISLKTGMNIVASKKVTGAVTANLVGVDLETALAAILKSTGFAAAKEGNIIYVGEPIDLQLMNLAQDHINTRVYRPNYAKAADVQVLFTPLLSTDGKITVTTASQIDIPADQTKTGGNGFAGIDTVVVRDYETILLQLDEIFAEVDTKPRQVALEAMILSVKLSDTFKFGVNFEALRDHANARIISGTPGTGIGSINVGDGGLHFGFLDATVSAFCDCLETIGDTNVIASPRLMCLNKQRAEIQIGEELGYVSTTVTESSSTQTINFLSVGTLLRMRPFIGNDGLIRLEVHPELSTGTVQVQQGLSLPQKSVTQVTTNVLCPDGCTIVIGGLIREDLTDNRHQLPWLGNMAYIGWLFRARDQSIDRNEIIVLITPRIVSEPFMAQEGQKYGNEFTQRQSIYFDKLSPIGKRNLALHHLRLARAAYNAGDQLTAMKQVNVAIHYDPLNRDAIVLRNDIMAAGGFEQESINEYLRRGLGPFTDRHHDYSRFGYPWKEFDGFTPLGPASTNDQGTVGNVRTITRPSPQPFNAFDPGGPAPLRATAQPEVLPVPTVPLPAPGEER